MKHHAADSKLRYSNEGAIAMNEVMTAFLQEVVWRAMNQASNEELTVVNLNHIEKILPQFVIVINITHKIIDLSGAFIH